MDLLGRLMRCFADVPHLPASPCFLLDMCHHLHLYDPLLPLLSTSLPRTQIPDCLEKFQELKQGKKLSYVIYGLSDDKKQIVVLKASDDKDFDKFIAELPEKECRWAVYDFEYTLEGGEGIRNKLTFVQWYVDHAGSDGREWLGVICTDGLYAGRRTTRTCGTR